MMTLYACNRIYYTQCCVMGAVVSTLNNVIQDYHTSRTVPEIHPEPWSFLSLKKAFENELSGKVEMDSKVIDARILASALEIPAIQGTEEYRDNLETLKSLILEGIDEGSPFFGYVSRTDPSKTKTSPGFAFNCDGEYIHYIFFDGDNLLSKKLASGFSK